MNESQRPGTEPAGPRDPDRERREYPHGTGDRNTHPDPDDRGEFRGGEQRESDPEGSPPAR